MTYSISHGTFSVTREFPVPVERVWAAWETAEAKRSWFAADDDFIASTASYELDFRVGGVERLDAVSSSGRRLVVETVFQDIVPNERIVATYDVLVADRRISVSLWSVQFGSTETGTRIVTTEHGAFLDDLDNATQRQMGVERDFAQLERYLEREAMTPAG